MEWKEKLNNLQRLLNEGKTKEVIDQTQFLMGDNIAHLSHENKAEACAFRGMAYYRRKDFGHADFWFTVALGSNPSNERAIYGMAYLAAYVDKNSDRVHEWIDKLPEGAARDNALVIIARSDEYLHDAGVCNTECEVKEILEKYLVPNPQDYLNTANIFHNAARFYMKIPEDEAAPGCSEEEDLCKALAYLQMALGLYGTGDPNLHHRAAANYWTSVAMEKLFGPAAAVPAACESVQLWCKQLQLDPTNKHFEESCLGAHGHLNRLDRAIWEQIKSGTENRDLQNLRVSAATVVHEAEKIIIRLPDF